MAEIVIILVGLCAGIPCLLFIWNLSLYRAWPKSNTNRLPPVSILIPARNEEKNIQDCLNSLLQSRDIEIEIIVLNDGSTDATGQMVQRFVQVDSRVKLITSDHLPAGWAGKLHACHLLSQKARHPIFLFLDADVRVKPDAVHHLVSAMNTSNAALVSGVPRQMTGTFLEKTLVPLIHFLLLAYLPFFFLRRSTASKFGAGCGQCIMVRRDAYLKSGGHRAIRQTWHDGLQLPRLLRRNGYKTDLFDLTALMHCRMYQSRREVWNGLGKNSIEGLGSPKTILPMSALLLAGQVVPPALVILNFFMPLWPPYLVWGLFLVTLLPRLLGVFYFRQSLLGAILHPLAILLLLAIQWIGFINFIQKKTPAWKGRVHPHLTHPHETV